MNETMQRPSILRSAIRPRAAGLAALMAALALGGAVAQAPVGAAGPGDGEAWTLAGIAARAVAADPAVPADAPEVIALAKKAVGKEKNPYRQAKALLDHIGAVLRYEAAAVAGTPVEALAAGRADAWDMALLYAASLRAAGIPALPVAGVVMDDSRRAWPHAWTEFYIYGFGWVPVDPALYSGASIGSFIAPFSDRSLYFGNMDDRHIAFSRGLSAVDRMTPDGRTVSAPRRYSIQTIFEEATGEIEAYTSFWSDVEITGVY